MHYNLPGGIVVKTENAAKPATQASRALSQYISRLEVVRSSFDYGCGKLRYADPILRTTETLTVVDSEIQVARTQVIQGRTTTVRGLARRSNRMAALNVMQFSHIRDEFDRGFCINVLPVIPFFSARRHVLKLLRQRIRPGGTCLFVVQYRNSDFNRMRSLPNARRWRDDFLIDSLRGFSFYGLISPRELSALVTGSGFEIVDQFLSDGSVFLMARSLAKPPTEVEVVSETNFRVRARPSRLNRRSP